MTLEFARILTTPKPLTRSKPYSSEQLNVTQTSIPKPHIIRTANTDGTSLFGLLILTGLMVISACAMVVDVATLRQVFQPDVLIPGQYETAEQVSR